MQFIEAANYQKGRPGGDPRAIVIHVAVTGETASSAEGIAAFFHNQKKSASSDSSVNNPPASTGDPVSSAHYAHDSDSTVQCVRDGDTAWDAPPNTTYPHIGHEHAGTSTQTRDQWLDSYGKAMLRRSAKLTAKQSANYNIPVRRLSVDQIKAKEKGFAAHGDIARAFGMSDHFGCPGDHFPWDWYLTRVERYRDVYVQYLAVQKGGKVVAKSQIVRATNANAFLRFLKANADKLRKNLNVNLRRERRF